MLKLCTSLRTLSCSWRRGWPFKYKISKAKVQTSTLISLKFTSLRARVLRTCKKTQHWIHRFWHWPTSIFLYHNFFPKSICFMQAKEVILFYSMKDQKICVTGSIGVSTFLTLVGYSSYGTIRCYSSMYIFNIFYIYIPVLCKYCLYRVT